LTAAGLGDLKSDTLALVNNGTLTVSAGTGLTGSGTFAANQSSNATITLAHADTSSQASSTNTGATVIQSISLDGLGHLTSLSTKTIGYADVGAPSTTGTNASGTWGISITGSATGNAGTATTLATARTINGVSFNGSANITVEPYVEDAVTTSATRYITFVDNSTAGYKRLNEDADLTYNPGTNTLTVPTVAAALSGNATTATTLQTARTISLSGDATGSVSFNGSANVTIPVVIADDSHNHDGRYYTEAEADARFIEQNAYIDFTVAGDANTYYPVLVGGAKAFAWGVYNITRGYSWTAPDTWYTATHKGGLTLSWRWSGDSGWGGNDHTLVVEQFGETYSTMVGGMVLTTSGLVVWLRGGTAQYRYYCPAGDTAGATVYLSGYTASNGTVYAARPDNTGNSEIYSKWPVRGSAVYSGGAETLTTSNYTSYAPTKTGGGASGSWGISITGSSASTTGNAASATVLQTARSINGVSFNGSADITITAAANGGNADTTDGYHASQSESTNTLATRNASGYLFANYYNGSGTFSTTGLTTGMARFTGTNGSDTYGRSFTAAAAASLLSGQTMNINGSSTSCSGNAGSATVLQTARTINGVSFNGSANITVEPYVEDAVTTSATRYVTFVDNTVAGYKRLNEDSDFTYNPGTNTLTAGTFSGALSGNATTATTLQTARTINGVSFNGSANITVADSTKLPLAGGTATGTISAPTFNATSTTNGGFQGIDADTATSPSFTWTADLNTGMYRTGTDSIGFTAGGVLRLTVNATAVTAAGNIVANSDERLKKDWSAVGADFVERLSRVKSGTYTRTDSDQRQAGSSAQDWQKLLPEVVTESSDELKTLSLAYGNAALVSAVELAKRVVEQDAKIRRLELIIENLAG